MSTVSKIEARIVVPTGGWQVSVTDSGGAVAGAITLAASETYYHSTAGSEGTDLPAEMQSQLNGTGVLAGTYTVTVSAGAGGTGKYTIACDESFSLSWTDSAFRDAVGFTSSITSQTTATGANHAQGLWLPGMPADTPYGLTSSGRPMSASNITIGVDGLYSRWEGNSLTLNEYVWTVPVNKAIAASESTTNESWETFWLDAVRPTQPWAQGGRSILYYADADTDGTSIAYCVLGGMSPNMTRSTADYDGWWDVRLEVVAV